jgi:hypothetical protein
LILQKMRFRGGVDEPNAILTGDPFAPVCPV